MLPEKFISRIRDQQYVDPGSLLVALEQPSPVSIRINSGKWGMVPADSSVVPWCETGYYLQSRPSFTLDPLFHSGCYYPREASGMFLGEVFRQTVKKRDNLWALDLCGAPGGKSTQISDLIGQTGHLVANEVIRSRAPVLAETLTKWGSSNAMVSQNDPAAFSKLEGWFDIIVVDAPCSGEGMFRTNIAVQEWSEDNAAHCAVRQKRIISDVWPALKEEGLLIYSTCTFNPAENEENVKWICEKNEAESLRLDISAFPGITEISHNGIYGYGFYPGKIEGEGFFISVIRKKEIQERINVKTQKKNEFAPSRSETANALKWYNADQGRLLSHKDRLFSIPCEYDEFMHLFRNLNIIKRGTDISITKNEDFIPLHDLVLSQLLKNHAFNVYPVELRQALLFLRRDAFDISDAPDGWIVLTYNGVNIGFVKKIGKRINNYFPVEWRIRMNMPAAGEENIIRWKNGEQTS
ncbi:MAG TPA: rRNA cytosine-C5-methyltransferase [Bacteroidales bacterium]|nr:rRNA cytosine-C5-methyltransferase [Bacteroidales bacterium]